ncbi:MAG: hypothetical protein HN742_42290 [Lentisphaerae bacterium]|jgi:uncharacterized protein YjiK|nr:hypothetical protein [Lentisphaerota bacterium]MBT4818538.1 hypothetical protein [Lentisphaerota bacterium]MBT5605935.1 hypothetical protein [Lentisphaerota bacterium]MBT7058014.1 hypothetical protein [Lentisphaerota bacterium]MBT7848569.1 hypothetical protein [Lentisphaerota bacterium]
MNIPYDLENPKKTYELSNKYREISGICPLQGLNSLAFVEDEAVRVHRFDLSSEKITKYAKHGARDSEDITILGNTAYILTAGKHPAIYRVADYTGRSPQCHRHDLNLNEEYDPEGLCHDAKGDRLLIACKGSPTKGDTGRGVFPFDIQLGRRAKSPVLTIDCQGFLGEGESTFNPSGIAVHPITNDVYLIGTKGTRMIVCCGWDGRVKGAARLDRDRFEQPEGIAFAESGELIVCSEGAKGKKGKKASIFVFAFVQ